jgi:DNA repair exonuclease SbcCD ATPase subunit
MPSKNKTRRFVLLSDLHAHAWSAFSKGEGADNSRLTRSLKILDESLAKARSLGVPWVFAGDIVHTAGYALNTVLGGLTEVLLRYPDVDKLAVWGNHDARGIGGKITLDQTVLATLSKVVQKFKVLDPSLGDNALVIEAGGLTFSGAGYQPRGDLLVYGNPADVGVYHQTVRGTKTPNGFVLEEGVEAAELLKRHRVVVVGHVHHWQYHPEGLGVAQMLLIPGSPEHHNFGDMGEHGWWVIDVPQAMMPDEPSAVFVPGGSPEFRTVEHPSAVKNDGNFYRVSGGVDGTPLPQGAIAIAPTPTTILSRDLLHGARGDQALSAWLKAEPPEALALGEDRFMAAGRTLLGPYEVSNLRPLKLTQVRIRNFCSYCDQVFDVKPGTWLVMGRGRDFPSNGAGKSTLFEAIFWTLFGRTTKGLTGDEVIRWGTDDCEVSIRLASETEEILVTRSRGDSSQLQVELNGVALEAKSVNELTEKLGQRLGITAELYQALGYFSQEKLLLFASATDGERKDMLTDLIGLGAYQEASQAAFGKLSDLQIAGAKIVALKEAAQARQQSETQRLADVSAKAVQWESGRAVREQQAHATLFDFEKAASVTREGLVTAARAQFGESLDFRQRRAQELYDEARVTPEEPTNTLAEFTTATAEHTRALASVKSTRTLIGENERQQLNLKARISSQVVVLAEGKCPSCGQEITPENQDRCLLPIRAELDALHLRHYELSCQQQVELDAAVKTKTVLDTVTAGVEAARRRERWMTQFRDAEKTLSEIELESVTVEANAQSHASKVLADRRQELARVVAAVQMERNPYTMEQEATRQRLQESEVEVMQHSEARIRTQEEIAIYDYWRRGFSKQGIQSLLVDEVAGLFNAARGTIFPALTQGVYDVQFSTLSQTKAGEWREKTEFQILEHGQLVPYAALSGGQRRRVDVGVMLTLVKAVSKWMQVPGMLGMLVLDEVFGFLDGSGAEGLMEALREMQEQIPTIFVVSHEPSLQALFPEVLVVEQDQDGVSRLLTEQVPELVGV